MSLAAVFLLVATGLYAGFQWTIRLVVYPQFAAVPAASFAGYERAHQQRVTTAVGPLFVLAGAAAITAFVVRPGIAAGAAAACVLGGVVVTGLVAVPLHRRLDHGFDVTAHRRLLRVDTLRLGLAVLACAAAIGYALG